MMTRFQTLLSTSTCATTLWMDTSLLPTLRQTAKHPFAKSKHTLEELDTLEGHVERLLTATAGRKTGVGDHMNMTGGGGGGGGGA